MKHIFLTIFLSLFHSLAMLKCNAVECERILLNTWNEKHGCSLFCYRGEFFDANLHGFRILGAPSVVFSLSLPAFFQFNFCYNESTKTQKAMLLTDVIVSGLHYAYVNYRFTVHYFALIKKKMKERKTRWTEGTTTTKSRKFKLFHSFFSIFSFVRWAYLFSKFWMYVILTFWIGNDSWF